MIKIAQLLGYEISPINIVFKDSKVIQITYDNTPPCYVETEFKLTDLPTEYHQQFSNYFSGIPTSFSIPFNIVSNLKT